MSGGQVQFGKHCDHGVRFKFRQFVFSNLPNTTVDAHDFNHRLIKERHTMHIQNHVAAIQLADKRNHGFR